MCSRGGVLVVGASDMGVRLVRWPAAGGDGGGGGGLGGVSRSLKRLGLLRAPPTCVEAAGAGGGAEGDARGAGGGGVALAGSADGWVHAWSAASGEPAFSTMVHAAGACARAAACCAAAALECGRGRLHPPHRPPAPALNCMAASADGRRLVTGGSDFLGAAVDIATGVLISRLAGHSEPVLCAHIDNSRAVTGAADGFVKVRRDGVCVYVGGE